MDGFRVAGALVVGALTAAYLYFGGRFSIALVIIVGYGIYCNEASGGSQDSQEKLDLNKQQKKPCCSDKKIADGGKKTGGCCSDKKNGGGKGGGCCSSKGGKKGGCCSSKGGKKGGCCSSKKNIGDNESTATEVEKAVNYPVTVDFTEVFKKPTKKRSSTPKVFSKNSSSNSRVGKKLSVSKKIGPDGLIKSALTISNETLLSSQIYVLYSSLQGAASKAAKSVYDKLKELDELTNEPKLLNLDDLSDFDDYFINVPVENALYVLVLPSYDIDCPLDYFLQTLEENANDFRVDSFPLRKLVGYTVLGLGDSESWPEKFCYQAKRADHWISRLGGRRIFPLGKVCMKTGGSAKIDEWTSLLAETLKDDEPIIYEYDENADSEEDEEEGNGSDELGDVEDIGGKGSNGKFSGADEIKQMVAKDSPTYKNLTKQGYKVIGSHSGVKICRWTKNELRGKGSCYKKSLFNIASSRCMELTPSLACSSKCVFCWRHGTNPVSKNWRWEVDEPEYILENALKGHYSMIKQMRGVPGVIAERFAKAFEVRHCALSLVGEPILYPHINKFIQLLHQKGITSFLVCNAQHPEALRNIVKVTQLYVSIDAPTKTELKKVDRPLYKDFWERMVECLEILKTVQNHQRTVFRLTLVKGFNMGDVSAYADLVQRGLPGFIEVKGATFSGSSDGNGNPLTMQNIPFYEECVKFVKAFTTELQRRGLHYDLAAEHAHSNCLLIADTKFKINGEWHTHIDFDKFFVLLNSGKDFTYMDYLEKTPEWALFGNGGFAPGNTRVYRKDKKKQNKENQETTTRETPLPPIPA
ncbi:AIC_G0053470.mRNA.1.CDS.1 [Saccharomyces cerevisiae]|uniref:S-adenosyl-L-methionine-dependent tRNA 4-demethylwyosine synthase n=2 Tax=Saccharomyces TaxID=4930 RepID=C8ZIH2_YEAS8|nr:Tyw1p [Saccharomyces cerevisiae YJM1574]AJV97778.1 Tyw1p [Saccharomyces cerevisiae YJM270]EGA80404.1 Tyw1p [Saccharomyces cerevisiae Lalvin QA23]EHN04245.1 Tyw1p [Saccharomyces cerevisiae x Saccharomyces kudriavzevii VIN7]PTN17237.1 putative tRNA 4-demethylwyosine synthase [Saccharomyces cerevisiae]CAY86753.1 Tyw1p [Saccharomyces cerevisiae EC1118]